MKQHTCALSHPLTRCCSLSWVQFPSLSLVSSSLWSVRDHKVTNTGLFQYQSSLVWREHCMPWLLQLQSRCMGFSQWCCCDITFWREAGIRSWCWRPKGLSARVTQELQQGREEEEWQTARQNIVWGGAFLFLNWHSSAHVTDGCHQKWGFGKGTLKYSEVLGKGW